VEDDPDDRDLMVWALKSHGIELDIVFSIDGREAQLKLLEREPDLPALVITDLKLPKINGVELLRWFSRRPEYKDVPKVVVTSSGEGRDQQACLELGALYYFQKPMTLDGYKSLVERLRGILA
jgi:DNA-binding response OmpR family regulator